MDQLLQYLHSPELADFMQQTGIPLILITSLISFIALLLEVRLPINYYWGLPGHGLRSVLRGLRLMRPVQPWGVCRIQDSQQPLPLVACELLDEQTKQVKMTTYSNHQGEYGFKLVPGKYLLRATKTHYRMPSLLDPENLEIIEIDQSFVVSVAVINQEVVPTIDLPLVPVKTMNQLSSTESVWHYLRMFLFQMANVLLVLNVGLSLLGWYATRDLFYGVMLVVCVMLLFIKLYILETISHVTKASHA